MSFATIIFLTLFLPIFLIIYYLLHPKLRNLYVILVSILFYFWSSPSFLWLLLLSVLINYVFGVTLHFFKLNKKIAKILLTLGIIFNVVILGYFKYANFFVAELNTLFSQIGLNSIIWTNIALPLAISFYIFHGISYIIDVYKGEEASLNPVDFSFYMLFFPKIISGPITRWKEMKAQIQNRQESVALFFDGIYRFSLGLAMKVLIADTLGGYIVSYYQDLFDGISSIHIWIIILSYTFQLFFDFAGYSHMAIGLSKMIGITLPENFNRPYLSTSVTDFWRRWHITLGQFLKDYIYIPLGGNRVSKWRNAINFVVVFTLGGLWHGAGFHFIAWGFYYGLLLAGEKHIWGTYLKKIPKIFQIILTFFIVVIGWVFFSAPSLSIAFKMLKMMFLPNSQFFQFAIFDFRFILILILAIIIVFFPVKKNSFMDAVINDSVFFKSVSIIFLIMLSIIFVSGSSFNAFIYAQF